MGKILCPRNTAEFITKISKNVHINQEGVARIALEIYTALIQGEYSLGLWKENQLNPTDSSNFAINWIFLVDSINFSYWPDPGQEFAVTYKDHEYTGYWAICAAINRALSQNIPMVTPEFYGNLSLDQVKKIFRAHRVGKPNEPIEMPMLEERTQIMRENGQILEKKFSNTFVTMILKAKNSAATLLKMIYDTFPSFRDELVYNGEPLGFYKRAQQLIGDIHACYEGEGLGLFKDIEEITMFADFRVPQCLYFLGVLEYKDELIRRLRRGEMFRYGDPDEVEIRAVSIQAVEKIKQGIVSITRAIGNRPLPVPISAVIIDFYLWDLKRSNPEEIEETIPYHKTRSIHY